MSKLKSIIESQAAEIIVEATALNYWGKKLRTSCAAVAGQIADAFTNGDGVSEIMQYLDANKPAKATRQKAADVNDEPLPPSFDHNDRTFKSAPVVETDRPVIVYAVQNNASICAPAYKTAQKIAEYLSADLMPVGIDYIVNDSDEAGQYMTTVNPAPSWIGGASVLVLAGEVLPTAKKPVSNARLLSGDRALTVLPHVKQQAESLPRAKGQPERWALTTGTLTLPRYRAGRAGAEAADDHAIGFTVVYPNGRFDQVALDSTGCGFWRGLPVSPAGMAEPSGDSVLIAGDIHAEKSDPAQFNRLVNLIDETGVGVVVLHDLLDFTSRNHHNRGSGLFLASQMGRTIADDLGDAASVLRALQERDPQLQIVVVCSNHDRALDRWLEEADPRQDPVNLPLWCDLQKPRYVAALDGDRDLTLPLARGLQLVCSHMIDFDRVVFLGEDDSFMRHGAELGQHGDRGINGARGGAAAFERLGTPYIIGHTHSGYKNGRRVAVAGVTGSMDMGYNKGASSWSNSHVILTNDGNFQIIE